jgi:hypothetical protein
MRATERSRSRSSQCRFVWLRKRVRIGRRRRKVHGHTVPAEIDPHDVRGGIRVARSVHHEDELILRDLLA